MLAFVALHLLTLLLDPLKPFSVVELVWPLAETYRPVWAALGVLGLYLLLAILATSWLRRTLGARTGRAIHLTSYAAFVLLTLHGLFFGTDARTPWVLGVYGGACGMVLWLTAARIMLGRGRTRDRLVETPPVAPIRPVSPMRPARPAR
jgi:methionine sulfoxide reductase heme-binding subunit